MIRMNQCTITLNYTDYLVETDPLENGVWVTEKGDDVSEFFPNATYIETVCILLERRDAGKRIVRETAV